MSQELISLLIDNLAELANEIKAVRQQDIPALKVSLTALEARTNASAKFYAAIGGGIAFLMTLGIAIVSHIWR